ncbi:putative transmembrane protein (N-terminal); phosphatase (C-terminal) [Xenorhabdus bovienii str. Intermedium]|uniref:Putative transmembrane protein (N-terminal) phosphatase (C-terminal) n=1 Tax=Xenorhabdus bovienii str. Intermedium TaxID=1379677 RepID=A0A077QES6_XENBV|nr:putative transmembrane protein (N-terminal); phosphatase (C-terminal) [Xenorhabdus bovienii str. Intermedium]
MSFFDKNKKASCFVALFFLIFLIHKCFGYQLKLIYVFSAFALFLFLAALSKRVYLFLITFFSLVAILYAPVGLNYGFPDINAVGSLLYTNQNETLEYISGFPVSTYLTVIGIFALMMFSFRLNVNLSGKNKKWLFFLFFIPAFWSPAKGYIKSGFENGTELLNTSLPEVRFFSDAYQSYTKVMSENSRFAKIIKLQDDWQPVVKEEKYDTYIMVIGESVRKDFLGAYGFPAKNTPWLDNANATLLTHYISAAPSTQLSLTNSLAIRQSNGVNLNNSIVTLANKAGFETYWLSNQGMKGGFDSPVAMIGQQAKHSMFLKEGSSDDRSYMPDENLLPYVRNALKNDQHDKKKKLVIIHLMGSHPQPCARTNNQYSTDFHSKNISCYVQSIHNTDSLLAEIENIANQNQLNWTMLYFADHGLSFVHKGTDNENLTHGDKNQQNYQVPFIITSYDYSAKNKIDAQRSGLHLLPMLSLWLGIEEPRLVSECDWFSNQKCQNQHTVISFDGKHMDFNRLNNDAIHFGL